jgi:hypothetical protein
MDGPEELDVWITPGKAGRLLGLGYDAVYKRIRRGTLGLRVWTKVDAAGNTRYYLRLTDVLRVVEAGSPMGGRQARR